MIGTVTFDGLSPGRRVARPLGGIVDVLGHLGVGPAGGAQDGVDHRPARRRAADRRLLPARDLGERSVGGRYGETELGSRFIHTLVPIAAVYVAAHYFSFLIFEGQAIIYLASDPFGQGWDLFGTASRGIDYSLLSNDAIWYFQVGFVVCGHVAALILAHDRALVLYGQARQAIRSQYWMLAVMVGFTSPRSGCSPRPAPRIKMIRCLY